MWTEGLTDVDMLKVQRLVSAHMNGALTLDEVHQQLPRGSHERVCAHILIHELEELIGN